MDPWTANEPPGSPEGLDNFANTIKKKPTTGAEDNQLKCLNGPGDVYASISHRKSCAAIPCPSAAHLLSWSLIGHRISGDGFLDHVYWYLIDQSQVLFNHYEGVIGPSDTKNFINLPD